MCLLLAQTQALFLYCFYTIRRAGRRAGERMRLRKLTRLVPRLWPVAGRYGASRHVGQSRRFTAHRAPQRLVVSAPKKTPIGGVPATQNQQIRTQERKILVLSMLQLGRLRTRTVIFIRWMGYENAGSPSASDVSASPCRTWSYTCLFARAALRVGRRRFRRAGNWRGAAGGGDGGGGRQD